MNTNLLEIQENLPEYDNFVQWFNRETYTTTSLEKCQRWELREALSYFFATVKPNGTVNAIVKSVLRNQKFDWTNRRLNIVDEAKVQNILRNHSVEVIGQDIWPTDSTQLTKLTKQIKLHNQIKYKFIDRALHHYESLKQINLANHEYLLFFIVTSIILGQWAMFAKGLALGYVLWIFLDIVRHEYIEHRYIEPRFAWLSYPIKLLAYHLSPALYHDANISEVHNNHHVHWKTDKDNLTHRVRSELVPGLLNYDLGFLTKSTNQTGIYKYYIEMKLVILVVAIILFGLANVFYYGLLPLVVIGMLQLQHDFYFYRLGERDHPWLFLLAYNQAWHFTHHKTYKRKPNSFNDLFNGPSWVKYVNPQYYFVKLLFKFKQ